MASFSRGIKKGPNIGQIVPGGGFFHFGENFAYINCYFGRPEWGIY